MNSAEIHKCMRKLDKELNGSEAPLGREIAENNTSKEGEFLVISSHSQTKNIIDKQREDTESHGSPLEFVKADPKGRVQSQK